VEEGDYLGTAQLLLEHGQGEGVFSRDSKGRGLLELSSLLLQLRPEETFESEEMAGLVRNWQVRVELLALLTAKSGYRLGSRSVVRKLPTELFRMVSAMFY
jgi:hypothetical protein